MDEEITMTENYRDALEYLSARFTEVNGYDFYQDIFPNNENAGALYTDFSHPNAIYLYRDENCENSKRRLSRRIMLSDTWEQDYMDYVEGNLMTLCSGLTYRRRANKLENAQRMNALVFDLDGVGLGELRNLFLRFGGAPELLRRLPMPTYLVISGQGLHIYYVFDKPIDLYPNIKLQLKQLKYDLIFRIWEYKATSQEKQIQYQSINQGFRMVGSINDRYGTPLRAFRVGERVTLDYLNQYARDEKNKVDINYPFKPSKMTRAEAAEKYPEWYQRVVIDGNKRLKKWNISGQKGHNGDELYNWWLRKVDQIEGGHRYFFMMCLAIYACKCDIPRKRLKKDMQMVFNVLKDIEHGNELTQVDVESALETYDKEYYNFTVADIERLTKVRIERNRRNGRKQKRHIEYMNMNRRFKVEEGVCTNGGRPSAEQSVKKWREQNPNSRKADCCRDTGLDPKTINKWW